LYDTTTQAKKKIMTYDQVMESFNARVARVARGARGGR